MIPILAPDPESPFPPAEQALENPPGLLAAGGDLSPARLFSAYRHGIFPWYSEGEPILWWSPAPRCVLFPDRVHVSRRLRRRYNQGRLTLSADQDFEQVIRACAGARPGQAETWITAGMIDAYIRLHDLGAAHSVEVWMDGELAGGVYGLALGQIFFGESMFSRHTDASKIALVALCRQLQRWDFTLLDCQVSNPHLKSMGAVDISRNEFNRYLAHAAEPDHWRGEFTCRARW
ncbi:MAG: leucyl/phenylalanyl-tRNA--protein transferase [Xanthomonadales bacterium]|nr:leucyl/phenylalanyl-tRNA--protein transferase [Xanthomonadales bacterium]